MRSVGPALASNENGLAGPRQSNASRKASLQKRSAPLGDVTNRKAGLSLHEDVAPPSQKSTAKPRRPLGDISNRAGASSASSSQKNATSQQLPPAERFFSCQEAAPPSFDCSGLKPETLVQSALSERAAAFVQPSGAAMFDAQSWQAYEAALSPLPAPEESFGLGAADALSESFAQPESLSPLNLDLSKLQLAVEDSEEGEPELAPPLKEREPSDSARASAADARLPDSAEPAAQLLSSEACSGEHAHAAAPAATSDDDDDMDLDDD